MQDITEQIELSELAIAAFDPKVPHRVWQVDGPGPGGEPTQRRYIQAELSFFEKQEFLTLTAKYFNKLISGELGVSLKDLFSSDLRSQVQLPTEFTGEQAESLVNENMEIIQAVINAIQMVPEYQHEVFLLALGVPGNEREWVKMIMKSPVYRGGFTDEQGFEILDTFIRQNAGPIRGFFAEKGRALMETFQSEVLGEQTEAPSKTETAETPTSPGGTLSSTTATPAVPLSG